MRDFLLLIAGAALSILGGFVQQWWQERRSEGLAVRVHMATAQASALVELRALAETVRWEGQSLVWSYERDPTGTKFGSFAPRLNEAFEKLEAAWDDDLQHRIFGPGIEAPYYGFEIEARQLLFLAERADKSAAEKAKALERAKALGDRHRRLTQHIDRLIGRPPRPRERKGKRKRGRAKQ